MAKLKQDVWMPPWFFCFVLFLLQKCHWSSHWLNIQDQVRESIDSGGGEIRHHFHLHWEHMQGWLEHHPWVEAGVYCLRPQRLIPDPQFQPFTRLPHPKQWSEINFWYCPLGNTHVFQQPFCRTSLVATKLLHAHWREHGVALVPCWFQLRKNPWAGNWGQWSSKANSWYPRTFRIPGHSPKWTSLREFENALRK